MKTKLTSLDLSKYAELIGEFKYGVFTKNDGVDLKRNGFYIVTDNKSSNAVFRFYVAPKQRGKTGANRTLRRIKNREHEPSSLVAALPAAALYFVPHDKIGRLFGMPEPMHSHAVQCFIKWEDGENYTEWNVMLNDIYDFEFQLY